MAVHPGYTYRKIPSRRIAQVSAITKTHALMYWPDKDEHTEVRLERLHQRPNEWKRTYPGLKPPNPQEHTNHGTTNHP